MALKNKTVAVTGAAGFIGSNLSRSLLAQGNTVIGIDNLAQGSMRNIADFSSNRNFRFVKADVRNTTAMKKACRNADIIAHLAAYKIPRYGGALNTLLVNALGTKSMLDAAIRSDARFLFASTSDVYGKNPAVPFSEESDFVIGQSNIPRWAYATSKIFDEQVCFACKEESGLKMSIVRYFGGYGPGQHLNWYGGPQAVFIDCVLSGKPMPLHGTGKQTRTFTYIDDQVQGTLLVMEKKRALGEVFNIGSTREITIRRLGELVHKLACCKGKPKFEIVPYRRFGKYEDVQRRVPDVGKAQKLLGFKAKMPLEQGLKRTIEWQKQQPRSKGKGKLE